MSVTFTKLFSSITESTIWCEPDTTRLAWITMLAMADRQGRVWASIPGLANRARISVDAARAAIAAFLGPDPDSRTPENEGRRIEPIDGGWRLLNHEKYRTIRDEESVKESKRRYINARRERERNAAKTAQDVEGKISTVERGRDNAEADTDVNPEVNLLSGKHEKIDPKPEQSQARKKLSEACIEVLNFLNEKTGRNYQPVKANINLIAARIKEGATVIQCRQVIAKKCREWRDDPNREIYLRPKTLFNATNFAQYQGELLQNMTSENQATTACICCGKPWTKRIGGSPYCQDHDQHSQRVPA